MINVIKRDGRKQEFDFEKIKNSIKSAADNLKITLTEKQYTELKNKCNELIAKNTNKDAIEVEKLQDIIESSLYICGFRKLRECYDDFRKERTNKRNLKMDIMKTLNNIAIETDRDNANVGNNFSAKLLRMATESSKWATLAKMPKELAKEHEMLDLYYHDLDSFPLTVNCLHIPTKEILEHGFNTGYGTINKPNRIESAAELSCILLQSTQNKKYLFL